MARCDYINLQAYPEPRQGRVDRTLQRHIAFANHALQPCVLAAAAQTHELVVQIEHQTRLRRAPREPRCRRVHAHDEKRPAATPNEKSGLEGSSLTVASHAKCCLSQACKACSYSHMRTANISSLEIVPANIAMNVTGKVPGSGNSWENAK